MTNVRGCCGDRPPGLSPQSAGRVLLRHWLKFNAVGAAGVVVQAAALAFLLRVAQAHYLVATALAVEAAVLHNFFWHQRWTWADRPVFGAARIVSALLRFNLTTGLVSIAGNLFFMRILVGVLGVEPLLANLVTIASCALVNFFVSDRLVFVA